jgi:Zn-dependent protease with chaperone function
MYYRQNILQSVVCQKCGTKNKIKPHNHTLAAKCGRCGCHLFCDKESVRANDYRVKNELRVLYASMAVLTLLLFGLLAVEPVVIAVLLGLSCVMVIVRQSQLFGQCVEVSHHQFPKVYEAVEKAGTRLSMKKLPKVFITNNPVMNAYAIGLSNPGSVVLNSGLVEAMNNDEMIQIIGHEFSHIKCGHTTWLVLTGSHQTVGIPILSSLIRLLFLKWSRLSELTCDRGGLLCSRNLNSAMSTMAKLSVGNILYGELNLDSLMGQSKTIDNSLFAKLGRLEQSHPYLVDRLRELYSYYHSQTYKDLVSKVG